MAVKTGVSMISFVITKEMEKSSLYNCLKKSDQYKNRHVNNYKPSLISENDRLHELQCKLKERQAASNHKGK